MQTKLIEIRDRGTTIIALAIQPGTPPGLPPTEEFPTRLPNAERKEAERWAWARSGYGRDYEAQSRYVLLYPIDPQTGTKGDGPLYDQYRWQNHRTMRTAHQWLIEHFDEIETGGVLDIEFILGETQEPKRSERYQEQVR